ncbi:Pescadillo [Dirofilaria immitis]|nr:Pescadillo [Dirofilaria immitis]
MQCYATNAAKRQYDEQAKPQFPPVLSRKSQSTNIRKQMKTAKHLQFFSSFKPINEYPGLINSSNQADRSATFQTNREQACRNNVGIISTSKGIKTVVSAFLETAQSRAATSGVYKEQGRSTENRVYYYAKDVNFLASEPIIKKFREYKIFLRKLNTAKAKRDEERVKKLYERRPQYQLDHIVKERYPTFELALRDLDDALCLLFAFAVLPHTKIITSSLVFISIKGIYYEAEVMGERVTWIVGHDRGVGHVNESEDNGEAEEGRIYSMACPLSRFSCCEEQIDVNITDTVSNEFNEKLRDVEKRKSCLQIVVFGKLVPERIIDGPGSCGGLVSWENCPAAQYYENNAQITHQIIDRPLLDNHRNLNRCYVQPQWVFDSFNRRSRLPVNKYLPGAILPPHLSPFSSDYNTYEEQLEQIKLLKKGHEIKLREMLIPKKRKRVYSKIKRGIKRRIHEQKKLNEKRLKILEAAN